MTGRPRIRRAHRLHEDAPALPGDSNRSVRARRGERRSHLPEWRRRGRPPLHVQDRLEDSGVAARRTVLVQAGAAHGHSLRTQRACSPLDPLAEMGRPAARGLRRTRAPLRGSRIHPNGHAGFAERGEARGLAPQPRPRGVPQREDFPSLSAPLAQPSRSTVPFKNTRTSPLWSTRSARLRRVDVGAGAKIEDEEEERPAASPISASAHRVSILPS